MPKSILQPNSGDPYFPESDGKYLLINILTRRAKELGRGGRPTIPYAEGNFDPVDVAHEELTEGNLEIVRRHEFTGEIETFEGESD